MKLLTTIVLLMLIAVVVSIGLAYSGYVNVGATVQHNTLSNWLLTTTMQKSVKRHAQDLNTVVPELGDHALILVGAENYDAMCATCHAPPGQSPSALAEGLNPVPPNLQESGEHMSAKELFWVTKHGIRMTGMPAWGLTHSDEELWSVVAFMKTLPNLGPEEYKRMVELAKRKGRHMQPGSKSETTHSGHEH